MPEREDESEFRWCPQCEKNTVIVLAEKYRPDESYYKVSRCFMCGTTLSQIGTAYRDEDIFTEIEEYLNARYKRS